MRAIRRSVLALCLPVLALALVAAPGHGPALSAQNDEVTYDFYISGIRAGQLTVSSQTNGTRYAAAGQVSSGGIIGAFARFAFDGRSEGAIADGGTVVPSRFVAESTSPRAKRRTEIEWRDGVPVRVNVDPPRDTSPDPTRQGGTLDPVSASYVLLRDRPAAEICATEIDIFDGSRVTRISLGKARSDAGSMICRGQIARIEGEAQSFNGARAYPFQLVYRDAGGMARLQRVEAPTSFGRAVLERRG